MKFRSAKIIDIVVLSFLIFLIPMLLLIFFLVEFWYWNIIMGLVIICIIAILFRYNSYVELGDMELKLVKSLKKDRIIPYSEIAGVDFWKIFFLPNIWMWHSIYTKEWETIEIWYIFHYKIFKQMITEKLLLNKNIDGWNTFLSNEWWFIRLDEESLFVSKNRFGEKSTLTIKYSDIVWIEVVILSENFENDGCCYIKLKNQKFKEAFYGIQDCQAFVNALKMKWINACFVSSDEIISDLKDEDLY